MPVFNGAAHLDEAVQSILAQTLDDLELVIVDDGSTDATPDIIADCARSDSRIRPLRIAREGDRIASGAHAANIGIAACGGAFYARMDSDDVAEPDRLALQLAHLRENGLDICGGGALKFGEREKHVWYPQTHPAIRNELIFRPAMMNSVMFMRTSLMQQARYSETDAFEEYEFLTRLVPTATMGNVPNVVHRFRQHDGSFSRQHRRLMLESILKIRFRYFFALFPGAKVADFRILHAAASSIPLTTTAELSALGEWLERLSRVEEDNARSRMERRWRESCDLVISPGMDVGALREDFGSRILARP
jgi:glycosyltransferase involved in cell wall biosynthesis